MEDELAVAQLQSVTARFRWSVLGGIVILTFLYLIAPAVDSELARRNELSMQREKMLENEPKGNPSNYMKLRFQGQNVKFELTTR